MTAILRLQLDDKDPVRVNSAINQLAEYSDRNQRTRLTANTTFYVSTSGSDSNSGSQTSPFLTIQHAYDVFTTFDTNGFATTIQCASGTYTAGLNMNVSWTGGGALTLDLGGGTISTSGDCINVGCVLPNSFTVQNGTLTSSGANCISHRGTGNLTVGTGMTFGNAPSGIHLACEGAGAKILIFNSYTISGNAVNHCRAFLAGNTIFGANSPVAITGTPAISIFVYASRAGVIDIESRTFTGSTPTGQRYFADTNGAIFTGGGGANYFPGTTPGNTTTGGVYV